MENECFRGLLVKNINEAKVILTGLPFDGNASIGKGACLEPKVMRELSCYFPPLTMNGEILTSYKMFDNGDVIKKDEEDCATYFSRIEKSAKVSLETGKFNLFIGGDHSCAIPTEKAFYDYCKKINKKPAIIHIDAHPDICDVYEDSKLSHACPNRRAIENGYETKDIVLIGIRGYEEQEVHYFEEHPEIDVYNATYIHEKGVDGLLKHLKQKFGDEYLVYLSYDIDANDPAYAPGTGTPEPFGLDNLTVIKMIRFIVKSLPVRVMDIVEISPSIDVNNITTWLGLKTMYEVFKELEDKE